jgi:tripartite-type tricarboxylate transporter receptor subunit TctC
MNSAIGSGIAIVCWASAALAQDSSAKDWPNKNITMLVPFAAGGGIDTSARVQAQALSEVLGQSVIVENVGAAGGTVGTSRVAKGTPDGYTFMIGNTGTHAYSPTLYKKLPYDPVADFEPIALTTESPRILIVRKDLPVNTLQEFVAYAKANQDKMQYGSAGVGSGTHLPCALLNTVLGLKIAHVPYRGAGPAMQDLVGGRIDYMCDTIQTGVEQAKSGTVKGIAVMAPKRVSIIPELPTTSEAGVAGVEATVWNAFFFPKGTPKEIVRKMNKALVDMVERPDLQKRMETLGLNIVPPEQRTPEYLAQYLPKEIERWGMVIKDAGLAGIAGGQ